MNYSERIKLAEEHERFAQVLRQPDGTIVQTGSELTGWKNDDVKNLGFNGSLTSYRLKPEPKYRPMTLDDFVGAQTIWVNRSGIYCQAISMDKTEICICQFEVNYTMLFINLMDDEKTLYSIDGRATWHRFRVEVAE